MSDARPGPSYWRAVDPFPLTAPEDTRLHEFYGHLAAGRLTTTRCAGCGRLAWPPRGFCPACVSDRFEWADLPAEGRVHGFSVQETGVPAGFPRPLVLAMVEVLGLRILAPLTGVPDPATLRVGDRVRLAPRRVADDPRGRPRWLPAFTPAAAARPGG
jgi:uncharacterized OB-fold protein